MQPASEATAESAHTPAVQEGDEPTPVVKQEGGGTPPATQGEGAGGTAREPTPVKQEDVKVRVERKALTLKERLEVCQATERQRLTFCKVRIYPPYMGRWVGEGGGRGFFVLLARLLRQT